METLDQLSTSQQSYLLLHYLRAMGFSRKSINFTKRRVAFKDFIDLLLLNKDYNVRLHVGSKAEGLVSGYFGSDTDIIMPFFEQVQVFDKKDKEIISKIKSRPTSLPAVAHDDPYFPGYVKLHVPKDLLVFLNVKFRSGLLSNTWGQHVFRKWRPCGVHLDDKIRNEFGINGPAVTEILHNVYFSYPMDQTNQEPERLRDIVPCLAYNYWPEVANSWISRVRTNNWPSTAAIEKVVSKKCLLAPVGHFDSVEKELQHRISFPGELILMENLNKVQIACYVMLKILKNDLKKFLPNNEEQVLSSFVMKHVVFWCVETDNVQWIPSNFVNCLLKCIERLEKYLLVRFLPHYIIEQRNLFNSKLTANLSALVRKELSKYKTNIMKLLLLEPFALLHKSPNFQGQVKYLKLCTECSVIKKCIMDNIFDEIMLFGQTNDLWLHYERWGSEQIINKYTDFLFKMHAYYDSTTVFKKRYCVIIASFVSLLWLSLYKLDGLINPLFLHIAKSYITDTMHSKITWILLRTATFLFMTGDLDKAIGLCSDLLQEKDLKVIPLKYTLMCLQDQIDDVFDPLFKADAPIKRIKQIRKELLRYAYASGYKTKYFSDDLNIIYKLFETGCFHFNVTYMTAEIWAVPDVIKYELLSVPVQLKKIIPEDQNLEYDQIPGIRINPEVNAHLLLFLSYHALGKLKERNDILHKLETIKVDKDVLEDVIYNNHLDGYVINFNILAYCHGMAGDNKKAAKYILKSLKKFPSRRNASFGYFKCVLGQATVVCRQLSDEEKYTKKLG